MLDVTKATCKRSSAWGPTSDDPGRRSASRACAEFTAALTQSSVHTTCGLHHDVDHSGEPIGSGTNGTTPWMAI